MQNDDITLKLSALLQAAGRAHHEAFADSDGADPEWPLWYANYLRQDLAKSLHAGMSLSELVYLLICAELERQQRAPGARWTDYYARFFAERYPWCR